MTQDEQNLPPFVIKNSETGKLQVPLKTLSEDVVRIILADTSRDTSPTHTEEWYKLRQGIKTLGIVMAEAGAGEAGAAAELDKNSAWVIDMPPDWEAYLDSHSSPDQ